MKTVRRPAAQQLVLDFELAACIRCGEWLPRSAYGKNSARPDGRMAVCKPCTRKPYYAKHPHAVSQAERRRRRVAAGRERPSRRVERRVERMRCLGCWEEFCTDRRTRTCSRKCQVRVNNCRSNYARRARAAGVPYETVDRLDVFERDGWICAVCTEPIDPTLGPLDPRSPSIDHRVPLVRGGSHTFDNCQSTHLQCNQAKGSS